ncbi:hypothetical protein J0A71_07g15360 [Encephalitozoon cuniculi]|uniref:Uncharacterized protein n=1 Tax=Encephalitozoon cuniculi TaxID=6035 RepID=M1JJM3_ENCCN|nr:hypothetical protein ECU06_0660 [Encephalitozoon cuniculi]UYI27658.1 hypothetical protein J0A71_07g15360 [Encephalitozoon cuniculi]
MGGRERTEWTTFEKYMDAILFTPGPQDEPDSRGPRVSSYRGGLENGPQVTEDREVLVAILRRRMNLLSGLRVVGAGPMRILGDDNVEMNVIKTSGECEKKSGTLGSVAVGADVYDAVGNEMVVSKTRDDSFLYVRKMMPGFEARAEFLFRRSLDVVESRRTLSFAELHSAAKKDGFLGLVVVDGKPVVLNKPCREVSVGLRSKDEGIMGNGIRGAFTIRLDGLDGSGREVQSVKLMCGYRRSDFSVQFDYHRIHRVMSREKLVEYYLDNKNIPLGRLLDGIVCISQPGSLRENCLGFLELKTSLFFGEAQISPYDLGGSLLFFLWMFGGDGLSLTTNKIIEYIEYVLSELDVCRDSVRDLLFLHETCIFINMVISSSFRVWRTGNSKNRWLGGTGPESRCGWTGRRHVWTGTCLGESCVVSAYYRRSPGNFVFTLQRDGCGERICRGDAKPIVRSSIGDLLLESLKASRTERIENQSLGLGRLLLVYRRLDKISRKGLGGFMDEDEVGRLVVSILEGNGVHEKEVLLLCTIVKDISRIVPVKVSVLDKALVRCIVGVVSMFRKRLRNLLRKGEGSASDVFLPIRRFYGRLRYLGSRIHEEVFESDLHHAIEEECFHRLRKASGDVRSGLRQVGLCRRVHEEHLRTFSSLRREIELSYCLEEKRALMRFYDVKRIKRVLRSPEILEKEVCKMIGEGATADDDMHNRYKLYLYECIKENAGVVSKDRYDETMAAVNKCFI